MEHGILSGLFELVKIFFHSMSVAYFPKANCHCWGSCITRYAIGLFKIAVDITGFELGSCIALLQSRGRKEDNEYNKELKKKTEKKKEN